MCVSCLRRTGVHSPSSHLLNALGQAFFSIGIRHGRVRDLRQLPRCGNAHPAAAMLSSSSIRVSVVAGLAVFPASCFRWRSGAGPGLAFGDVSANLQQMPAFDSRAAVSSFLLSAAALASMVSLLETCVAYRYTAEALPIARDRVLTAVIFALGLPSALGHGAVPG